MRSRLLHDAVAVVLSTASLLPTVSLRPNRRRPAKFRRLHSRGAWMRFRSADAPRRAGTWLDGHRTAECGLASDAADSATWSGGAQRRRGLGSRSGAMVRARPTDRPIWRGTCSWPDGAKVTAVMFGTRPIGSWLYKDDLPDGPGTAVIAGEALDGVWHRGCFMRSGKVASRSMRRPSCETRLQSAATVRSGQTE